MPLVDSVRWAHAVGFSLRSSATHLLLPSSSRDTIQLPTSSLALPIRIHRWPVVNGQSGKAVGGW